MLLDHYADEDRIDRFIRMGSVTWPEPAPEESDTYFRDCGQPWENCRPHAFSSGTERFFSRYWGPSPEWLYVWTPNGWLASPGMPGAPPDCYYTDTRTVPDVNDPEWLEWPRKTGEFQRPQSLHSLICDYLEQQRGSDDRAT